MAQVHEDLSDEVDRGLLSALRDGVTVVDKQGEPVKITPPAAYFVAAINRLKALGISKGIRPESDLARLAERLKDPNYELTMPPLDEEEDKATAE